MSLFLGDCSYAIYEIEGLLEIRESENPSDVMLIYDFPVGPVRQLFVKVSEFFTF